jgi:hypothetical protein
MRRRNRDKLEHLSAIFTSHFNLKEFYTLLIEFVHVFHMILTIHSDSFLKQH